MVNTDFLNSNVKSPCTIAKLETSSYQNSANISYKIYMGSNNNILPFCKYKILFPRSKRSYCNELRIKTLVKTCNNTTIRHIGTCYLTLMHQEKQKVCRFFVVPGSSAALLGMLDIETLGMLTTDDKTIGR